MKHATLQQNTTNKNGPPPEAVRMLNSAFACEKRSDTDAAKRSYENLTTKHPDFAAGWHYYGLFLHNQSQSQEALDMLEKAYQLEPENPLFLSNVATILWVNKDIENALRCASRAHELDPDHAQLLMQLARMLIATEQANLLTEEIRRHLKKAPGEWRLWKTLGRCLEQSGDSDGAIAAFTKAVELSPKDEIEPLILRGSCFQRANKAEEAEKDFSAALNISPESAKPLNCLANIASDRGDFEECERLARKALEREPRLYPAWGTLATCHPMTADKQLRRELLEAASKADQVPASSSIHFALGKVLEKLGDYDESFNHYKKGNDLQQLIRPYSMEADMEYTKNLITNLNRNFLKRASRVRTPGTGAIFICGLPRSGTTLVETMLACHPDVTPGGEQTYIHDYFRRTLGVDQSNSTGTWLSHASDGTLLEISKNWAKDLRSKADGAPRITDKLPGNYSIIGFIHACFPDAHIINVKRDPRDNCFSCYTTSFSTHNTFSYSLESLGYHYRLYETFMEHWRQVFDPGRIIELNYESLVENPETEIRHLLNALDLDWDSRCLEFYKSPHNVQTASKYQVRQPLYNTSINRWKNYDRHLKPLLDALEDPSPLV